MLGMGVVYIMFVVTAETPPPMETEAREYPGSARDVPSQVLPKTAREASEEFHRTYDDAAEEIVDEGDPIAESRRRNREKAERQQQQAQQKPQSVPDAASRPKQKPGKNTPADERRQRR